MKNKFQKSVTKKYKKENKKPLIITGVGVDNSINWSWYYFIFKENEINLRPLKIRSFLI